MKSEEPQKSIRLYDRLRELGAKANLNDSLGQLVEVNYSGIFKQDSTPEKHYRVLDICNPAQAYWLRKRKDTPRTKEVAKKLALGNRLQRIAFGWMRKIPGYAVEEALLDGVYVGVERVVGRLDIRMKNSIIEFKTKPHIVDSVETILAKHPNDLEQICFYAAMSPKRMMEHYLIFQLDHDPYSLSVFKIAVKDPGKIRNIMNQRTAKLDKALELSDPSSLGRCRYHDAGCDFKYAGVCSCASSEVIDTRPLLDATSIAFDLEKTKELESARKEFSAGQKAAYRPWELMKPRPFVLWSTRGIADDYESDISKWSYEDALRKAVYRTKALSVPASELEEVQRQALDLPIVRTWRFIALASKSDKTARTTIPALLKVRLDETPSRSLSGAYKAELAIATIVSAIGNQGAVVILYPNAGGIVHAHHITFEKEELKIGRKAVEEALAAVDSALKSGDVTNLDKCPHWAKPSYCSTCPQTCMTLATQGDLAS